MHTSTRIARLWRTIAPGRGSVARRSDRAQAALLVFVILTSLAAAVFAVMLGTGIYLSESARSRDETAGRHPANATLLADGPMVVIGAWTGALDDAVPTDATWPAKDGSPRFGKVDALPGMVRGTTVPIWVDRTGASVGPPLSATAAVTDALVLGVSLWAGVVFVLILTYRSVVFVLDRFRLARWQREWLHETERQEHP